MSARPREEDVKDLMAASSLNLLPFTPLEYLKRLQSWRRISPQGPARSCLVRDISCAVSCVPLAEAVLVSPSTDHWVYSQECGKCLARPVVLFWTRQNYLLTGSSGRCGPIFGMNEFYKSRQS